jgi:hypothetical protein
LHGRGDAHSFAVDGPFAHEFQYLVEVTMTMAIKLISVVIVTPIFLIPGVVIFILGGWCGNIYMSAQLSVKREMSNMRAPVLGHFGAAINGLRMCSSSPQVDDADLR